MRVLSVNVGLPPEVTWRGRPVRTGIYKQPGRGRVAISTLDLAGDGQADLRVHGGRDKAVYAHPSELGPGRSARTLRDRGGAREGGETSVAALDVRLDVRAKLAALLARADGEPEPSPVPSPTPR